jgi:LSD1 subclass zinc finger protein
VPIQVTCDSCRTTFKVKDAFGGKRGRCPKCQAVVSVPQVAGPQAAHALMEPIRPSGLELGENVRQEATPGSDRKADTRQTTELSADELFRVVLDAFEGEIPPLRKTFGYRLGIVLVTLPMLLLPLIYVALVAAVGYFLYWHATHNLGVIAAMHNVWILVFGYAGPLVAGVILIFFMIKPLFAPSAPAGAEKELEHGKEPNLFAFVSHIARAVGAPEPSRIEVSCEVNASARFGRGLGGFFGNNLVLTIGLPLVVGLTTRQLAGVLAHELGHFAQGAGMRFSYVVRSINHWFMRVVYEHDGWDEALARGCGESGRLAPILFLALLCIWLSRRVLWVLMLLGHGLSCFLTRQMEYDADRYMAQIAGSDTFEEIGRRLALWDVSSQATFAGAGSWWLKDRYPDDLPSLIVTNADKIPKKLHRQIQKSLNKSRTGLFDTHPCLKDRIANVSREKTEGIFRLDQPATALLGDYPKLARQVSLKVYQAIFGRHVKRANLVPITGMEPADGDARG